MAILNIGTFSTMRPSINDQLCRDDKHKLGNKTVYRRDFKYHKEDPTTLIKWMRRNFGERNSGWDFSLVGGCITVEIWDDRLITMYEMWYM